MARSVNAFSSVFIFLSRSRSLELFADPRRIAADTASSASERHPSTVSGLTPYRRAIWSTLALPESKSRTALSLSSALRRPGRGRPGLPPPEPVFSASCFLPLSSMVSGLPSDLGGIPGSGICKPLQRNRGILGTVPARFFRSARAEIGMASGTGIREWRVNPCVLVCSCWVG